MTIYADKPKRLRIFEEPNGSHGTDHSGTLGDFLACPFIDGTMKYELHEDPIDPGHALQHMDDANVEQLLPKFATASFDMNLETFTARAGNDTAAPQSALGRLLKIIMGGEHLGTGQSVSSATGTTVTQDSATGLRRGGMIACTTGTGGRLEAREVKDISSATATVKHAFSGTPSGVSYNGATYYLGGTDGSQTTSLQAIIEGLLPTERFGLFGGVPQGLTFSPMGPGGFARITTNWRFSDWQKADGAGMSADLDSGVLTRSTYTNHQARVIRDSEFRKQVNGTTTIGPIVKVQQVRFTPAIAYELHQGPDGFNTVYQGVRVPGGAAMVEFDIAHEDFTWLDHKTAVDTIGCWFQIGSTAAGGGILLSFPTLQVVDVQPQSGSAITGITVKCKLRCDGDTDAADVLATSDYNLAVSQFRVHLF